MPALAFILTSVLLVGVSTFGISGVADAASNPGTVGIATTANGGWTVNSSGVVTAFGSAPNYGSVRNPLNKPIVGMAATPDGHGYWLVASDGGIFTFGDAPFKGSAGAIHLNKPIVGMAATPDGHGYWLVASDGGIFTFGDAPFRGSEVGAFTSGAVGIAVTDGTEYDVAAGNGSTSSTAYSNIGPQGTGTETDYDFPGSSVNTTQWAEYSGAGNAGVGTRSPTALSVSDGILSITDSGTVAGGLCLCNGNEPQLYGHWEISAKTQTGAGYGPVILLWPKSASSTAYEIDIAEVPGAARTEMYESVHYGSDQTIQKGVPGNFTGWNTYGVDWGPDHVTFLLNGTVVSTITDPTAIPHVRMFLSLQEDMSNVPNWITPVNSSTPSSVAFQISSVKTWSSPALP
jgi:hypothetical protein